MATTNQVAQFKRHYFQNAVICGNCNGEGFQGYADYCRACLGTGIEPLYQFIRNHHAWDPIFSGVMYRRCVKELVNQYTIEALQDA